MCIFSGTCSTCIVLCVLVGGFEWGSGVVLSTWDMLPADSSLGSTMDIII